MIRTVTPSEFATLLNEEQRPVLAGCLENDPLHADQLTTILHIEKTFREQFSVCLLDPEYFSEFARTYAIAGTPSYLLFYLGEEKTRFIGFADALNLLNILLIDDYSELDTLEPAFGHSSDTVHPVPCMSGLFRSWKRQ
ncbi:hypothetical protein N1030_10700 [Desulfovibrio mangrovi]|uniref:hypothetical protein n=1 Tax=Desulfovibrio mangrovi TaxID=2976983 RepID=UPI0022457842|nr:hypothetical protein [Desulfovibrio mangrovi]UZP66092.1 hypothetical protein N1030_10700 [Desulfovibrio mangrovi]